MSGRVIRCASMILSLSLLSPWLIGCALSAASTEKSPNANDGQSTCYVLGLEAAKDDTRDKDHSVMRGPVDTCWINRGPAWFGPPPQGRADRTT